MIDLWNHIQHIFDSMFVVVPKLIWYINYISCIPWNLFFFKYAVSYNYYSSLIFCLLLHKKRTLLNTHCTHQNLKCWSQKFISRTNTYITVVATARVTYVRFMLCSQLVSLLKLQFLRQNLIRIKTHMSFRNKTRRKTFNLGKSFWAFSIT